jgi:hypothetical protein
MKNNTIFNLNNINYNKNNNNYNTNNNIILIILLNLSGPNFYSNNTIIITTIIIIVIIFFFIVLLCRVCAVLQTRGSADPDGRLCRPSARVWP